jgi:hypothetical protein
MADRRDYTPRRWNEPLLVARDAADWPAARATLTDP